MLFNPPPHTHTHVEPPVQPDLYLKYCLQRLHMLKKSLLKLQNFYMFDFKVCCIFVLPLCWTIGGWLVPIGGLSWGGALVLLM